jgi:RHS repeat-associated protein
VARTVDGVTTDYVLDPAAGLTQVLQETTGGQATSYLYGHDLLAQYDSGTWAYHVSDGLGSVRQLADPQGEVVASYSFSPFGVPLGESGGEPYGYTGEQWDAGAGLVFLRARYYEPGVGRFVSKDPFPGYAHNPQSLNRWVYVRNNPVGLVDPSGLQGPEPVPTPGQPVVPEGTPMPPGRPRATPTPPSGVPMPTTTGTGTPREMDPLSEQQWNLTKQEARRFGLPKELVASTIAAEIVYDTDWVNTVYDAITWITGATADFAYATRDRLLFNVCYETLEEFHEYFGLAPYLEEKGIGYGIAPGIANIHAGPAVRTENYINETYPDQDLLPDLGPENREGVRLRTLLSDEGSIRYTAAYLRWWADVRTGSTSDHTTDLTDTDMIIIYTAYRCDVRRCYGSVEEFQNAQTPSPYGHPNDFAVFLPLYKSRP